MNDKILPLAQAAEAAHAQLHEKLASIFEQLQRHDAVLAQMLIEVFGDVGRAMVWLSSRSRFLGLPPLSVLARGQRQDVLDELLRIRHGMY